MCSECRGHVPQYLCHPYEPGDGTQEQGALSAGQVVVLQEESVVQRGDEEADEMEGLAFEFDERSSCSYVRHAE